MIPTRTRRCAKWTVTCLGIGIVISAVLAGADLVPIPAPARPTTYPAAIAPKDVPLATSADIWVGVVTIPEALPSDAAKDMQPTPERARGIFAYVANRSDHPIRLYMPGLVGPNFGGTKGANVEALVDEVRSGARFGDGDFVILKPGETFGRRHPGGVAGEFTREVGAYYLIYPPDRIGHWSEVSEIVYPGGQVRKAQR